MRPRSLQNSDADGTRKNVPDVVFFGNGDLWQLLCKASSQQEGWMKSTKAMQVPGGCVVQVTTQQKGYDETYSVAEALTFVPGVEIAEDEHGGRQLVAIVAPAQLRVAEEPDEETEIVRGAYEPDGEEAAATPEEEVEPDEEVEDLVEAAVEAAELSTPEEE